jgi:hypothetical protein
MEITLTALGVLLAFVIGGWLLRLLVRMLGTRLLPQRMDALNVMGAIAFWGMVVVGLTLTVRLLAAPAVQDALATAARNSPALIAAVAVLVLGHLLGVALRDLLARSVRRVSITHEPLVRRSAYGVIMFFAAVMALGLVGLDVDWILNTLVGLVVVLFACFGIALAVGSVGVVQDMVAMRRFIALLQPGTGVRIGRVSGRIVEINETGVLVETAQGLAHLSGRYLAARPVFIDTEPSA